MKKRTISLIAAIALFALIAVSCDSINEEEIADDQMDETVDETAEDLADIEALTFEVSGTNFAFSETELTVKEGDTVRIIFTSEDGFHDWVLDEFDAATEQVQTGGVTQVTFIADKAGTYEYYCSVGEHRANGMVGTLTVN